MRIKEKRLLVFTPVLSFLLIACSPKYYSFVSDYTFKSADDRPDYSSLNYWAAHPWKKDPSDSIPSPLRYGKMDSAVDVFFIHPTTYTGHLVTNNWNAPIDDSLINAKTDYTTILYQASVFNQSCRVFAPRYRQAHLKTFYTEDKQRADPALSIAYRDVRNAFLYYLEHYNEGRPVIIAAHSQGTLHAEKILREFFDNGSLKEKLVCAYLLGWAVPKGYFENLRPCTDSSDTGCFVSWRTLRKGYIPQIISRNDVASYVTNPLNWDTTGEYADRNFNKGAILFNFNKVLKHTNSAQIHNNVLWISKPKFPFSFLSGRKNYHTGDINLFYMNIKENINTRITSYFNQQQNQ